MPPLDNIFDSTSDSDSTRELPVPTMGKGLKIDFDLHTQVEEDLFANENTKTKKEEVSSKEKIETKDEQAAVSEEEPESSNESIESESELLTTGESSEEAEPDGEEEDLKTKKKATTALTPNAKVMEARKDFEVALARISNSSNRRKTDSQSFSDSVEHDDYAIVIKSRMELALKRDIQSLGNGKPALERLKLLDQVLQALNRKNLQEILLENGILSVLRRWLEPLKTETSCTLPSANFRKPILEALKTLPIETANLRESGIGRIVYFFSKREGELADIRKLATELVDQWSRPILAGSRLNTTSAREEDMDSASGTSTPKLLESEEFHRHVSPSPAAASTLSVYQKLTSGKRTNRRK